MAYSDKTPLQKAEYANETKTQLVTSLKNKGFDIKDNNSFREIANIVRDNSTIVDTKDADALASNIDKNKTAYINGSKITGTLDTVVESYASATEKKPAIINLKNTNVIISAEVDGLYNSNDDDVADDKGIINIGATGTIQLPRAQLATGIELTANKILTGNTILGIRGTAIELRGQTKTVAPTTSQQTITPDTDYNGITEVTINAVDNTIDSNIVAGNIKSGVSILGIAGTYETDLTELEALASDILGETT